MSFIQVTTPLYLHADPTLPEHAVTKRYVDNKSTNISASSFTTGVISPLRMPALGGDISSIAGSGAMTLNVNGVTAGTYTKVTVDSTGRVTGGGVLSASDITSVSWGKIVSGKPTTAAGYGITGLISLSGGTVTGSVTSTAVPSAGLHAVTKGYVDNAITEVVSASLSSGDIVRKSVSVAPAGFLRCNGGSVSKTTYAGLFTVVGDKYTVSDEIGMQVGAGTPWVFQNSFNSSQPETINSWSLNGTLPIAASYLSCAVIKNKLFLFGGDGDKTTIYSSVINSDGTLNALSLYGYTPVAPYEHSCKVVSGSVSSRIYLFTNKIISAPIDSNGEIGSWTNPSYEAFNVFRSKFIVTKNRVYGFCVGAGDAGYDTRVWYANINSDGTLGTWIIDTIVVPAGVCKQRNIIAVIKNFVYMLGGVYDNTITSQVHRAIIDANGYLGAWTQVSSLPFTLSDSSAVVTKNFVYTFGGHINGVTRNYVQKCVINADGSLGTWSRTNDLPGSVRNATVAVTSSGIYLLGGDNASGSVNSIYKSNFTGGFNDYIAYFTNSFNYVDLINFRLPDFTSIEKNGINYFIKT